MTQIKYRNMFVQVLLMVITFGLYSLYWFYQTANEIKAHTKDEEAAPTLWLILMIVPLGIFYSYYKYCEMYAKMCSEKIDKWILMIIWFFFAPGLWFLVQRDLNKLAGQKPV
jgi:hypothetical protein